MHTNKPFRVLHVVTHMNRGGLETMIMNYYRNIDRNIIQFDFLTHRPEEEKKDYDAEIESLGGRIFHIQRLNPFSISYKRQLKQFFLKHPEYKIVHVHQDCMSGVILKIAKKCGIPVRIAHCHSSNQDKNLYYPLKLLLKKNISKYATALFACGEKAGRWMFGKKAKFSVLPNAIRCNDYRFDKNKRTAIRKQLGIDNGALVVGLVARFSKVKNHPFLVDMFEELNKREPDSFLVLVGDGETRKTVVDYVKNKNLSSRVLFLGIRTDIPDLLQSFDFFVMPSLYEGLPVSIIEAQASGLMCFISDKVPIDCNLTGKVKQLKISDTPLLWANEVLKNKNYERVSNYENIKNEGFDIVNNSLVLTNYYLNSNGKQSKD